MIGKITTIASAAGAGAVVVFAAAFLTTVEAAS